MNEDFSILIVEDDEDTRSNLIDIISLDGYRVHAVSNCLPAIQAVERETFDAVIVDWRLPDGDGGQLVPVIKREQPDTPIVVITGMRDFETALTALRSGAYDFLLKPVFPDALRSVLRRISERKQHLVEIEEAQYKLLENERLAAIGQMVAGLAHESRNAFQRSHACLAELELDLQDNSGCLELIRKVQKALDDLHQLLEEVRNYSAPIVLERRDFNMAEMIETVWQEIQTANAEARSVHLDLNVGDEFPDHCCFDKYRLQQVFRNLLENAAFACSSPGRIEVDLDSRVKPATANGFPSRELKIAVRDNGNGVPEAEVERIFQPFFTTKTKGTGLGLAISQRIVKAHGGRIEVLDNDRGPGARFVVVLPCFKQAGKQAAT